MDPENLALAKEEATLTKIRNLLNTHKVKLWEAPYYDSERRAPQEAALHELAVTLKADLDLPLPHLFQGLLMLQQHALEKLAARDRFKESGVASFKLRCAKGLRCKVTKVDIEMDKMGAELRQQVSALVSTPADQLKLIISGKVVRTEASLAGQGVKNNSTIMVVKVGDTKAMSAMEEQVRRLEETKADAARLGGRDGAQDDFSLQIADQSGKPLDLPAGEKRALVVAMSLHEKGRAALKVRDYPAALVLLLEADTEFATTSSDILTMVDNFAILSLDIAWCYLNLNTVSELPAADERLRRCEAKFKESYGADLERVALLKGSAGNEMALMARLNLLQGIVAFHMGRDKEASLLLQKCDIQLQLLAVSETDLLEIAGMGYSIAEARLGLRAAQGDRKMAVEHIMRRREEKEGIRRKEQEERRLGKLREKLGRCADGSWINIGYYNTLTGMGFQEKVAAAALRQANNSLNTAVHMLQEQPDLIQLAAETREDDRGEPREEELVAVISLGYQPDMARIALRNEGSVEAAVEALMAGMGTVQDKKRKAGPSPQKKSSAEEDREAYARVSEGIAEFEEDHLDLDLVEEGAFLQKYLALLAK